jgi:hypothetical protein
MCDTMVSVPRAPFAGDVWLAKNSDREASEAQFVEHRLAERARGSVLRATHVEIPEASATLEVAMSRPTWMWGAEMGVNERGVAIGNEAVFTRVPVARTGLTGMDLLRIALERATSAEEAVDVITFMIGRYGQGGRAGFRDAGFRYHNAFVVADPAGAWLLETAGPFWAAAPVEGTRTTSNVLTLGEEATRYGPGTIEEGRRSGHGRHGAPFRFRDAFADRAMGILGGGDVRRACSLRMLGERPDSFSAFARALRDHGGRASVRGGLRLEAPCAHASYLPTRTHGQTTGSMIVRLGRRARTHLFTGTSSPCLSLFKPVPLGRGRVDTGPSPRAAGWDPASLFWRHERVHRAVLRDEDERRSIVAPLRDDLEHRALGALDADAAVASATWEEHREAAPRWLDLLRARPPKRRGGAFDLYWRRLDALDHVPREGASE